MAASKVNIANLGLTLLGNPPILDLDEDNDRARVMNRLYPDMRREVLGEGEWAFAIKRGVLPATTSPIWWFSTAFALPADCIRVLNIDGSQFDEWQVEGQTIVCFRTSLSIRYIFDNDDPTTYGPGFITSLGHRLAAAAAFPLTNSTETARDMFRLYEKIVQAQKTVDSMQGQTPRFDVTELESARLGLF